MNEAKCVKVLQKKIGGWGGGKVLYYTFSVNCEVRLTDVKLGKTGEPGGICGENTNKRRKGNAITALLGDCWESAQTVRYSARSNFAQEKGRLSASKHEIYLYTRTDF